MEVIKYRTSPDSEWKSMEGLIGEGVPAGGTAGQVLSKKSDADYDTEWVDQTGGTGDSVAIDNYSIIKNENGEITTAIGGGYVDGLVDGSEIINFDGFTRTDVSTDLTYDIMQELISYGDRLRANLNTGFGRETGCLVDIDTSVADTYKLTCHHTISTVKCVYTGTGTVDNWSCIRGFEGGGAGYNSTGNSFYYMVDGKVLAPIDGDSIPVDNVGISVNADKKLGLNPLFIDFSRKTGALKLGLNENQYLADNLGDYSITIGKSTAAEGYGSIAVGFNNYASGTHSINIIGQNSLSLSYGISIGGFGNWVSAAYGVIVGGQGLLVDSSNQFARGRYNISDTASTYGEIFGIGSSDARANGYTLDWSGNATFAGTVSSSGADYAEFFEWADGNPVAEDRVGYIVTLDGDKIKLASAEDDVLGITSGTMTVLGDNAEWHWQGKYLKDEFGRTIVDMVEEFGENENGEKYSLGTFPHPRINPDYNPDEPYINRRNRPEWAAVGMMGKLFVRDDGSCLPNYYAAVGEDGIATFTSVKTNMRVMKRVNDNIVQVCLK